MVIFNLRWKSQLLYKFSFYKSMQHILIVYINCLLIPFYNVTSVTILAMPQFSFFFFGLRRAISGRSDLVSIFSKFPWNIAQCSLKHCSMLYSDWWLSCDLCKLKCWLVLSSAEVLLEMKVGSILFIVLTFNCCIVPLFLGVSNILY